MIENSTATLPAKMGETTTTTTTTTTSSTLVKCLKTSRVRSSAIIALCMTTSLICPLASSFALYPRSSSIINIDKFANRLRPTSVTMSSGGSFLNIPNPFASDGFSPRPPNSVPPGDSFLNSPEALFARSKAIIATDFSKDVSLLDDDFIWIAPNLYGSVLGKEDFIAAGNFFDIRSTFPDLDYRAHDFRLDSRDPNTVRCTVRTVGTMTGELRLRTETIQPNQERMICPPEAISMTFDATTGKLKKLCSGFSMDRLVGNTDGLCGVLAAASIAGAAPSEWDIYPPTVVLQRFFGRPVEQLPEPTSRVAPFPESVMIQLAKGVIAADNGASDPDLLSPSFTFCGPIVGPVRKEQFIKAFGGFDLKGAFPDLEAEYTNFRVDLFDPYRVWLDARGSGTNTGVFAGKEPTGKRFETPPEAVSITFDDDGFCTRLTAGVVMDPSQGNTGGLGGVYGIFYAIGNPLPGVVSRPIPELANRIQKKITQPITGVGIDEYILPTKAAARTEQPPPPPTPDANEENTIPDASTPKLSSSAEAKAASPKPRPAIPKMPTFQLTPQPKKEEAESSPPEPKSSPEPKSKSRPVLPKIPTFQLTPQSKKDEAKPTTTTPPPFPEPKSESRSAALPKIPSFSKQPSTTNKQQKETTAPTSSKEVSISSEPADPVSEVFSSVFGIGKFKTEQQMKMPPPKDVDDTKRSKEIETKRDKAKLAARERKEQAEEAARLKKEKAEEAARLKKEQAEEATRLKKEKAEEAARLKKEKAEEAARLKKDKAEETARLKKEKAETATRERNEKTLEATNLKQQKTKAAARTKNEKKTRTPTDAATKKKAAAEAQKSMKRASPGATIAIFNAFSSRSTKKTKEESKRMSKQQRRSQSSSSGQAPKGVPILSKWRKNRDGSVTGLVSGSDAFDDGEQITTSVIASGEFKSKNVVQTKSGSRYYLN